MPGGAFRIQPGDVLDRVRIALPGRISFAIYLSRAHHYQRVVEMRCFVSPSEELLEHLQRSGRIRDEVIARLLETLATGCFRQQLVDARLAAWQFPEPRVRTLHQEHVPVADCERAQVLTRQVTGAGGSYGSSLPLGSRNIRVWSSKAARSTRLIVPQPDHRAEPLRLDRDRSGGACVNPRAMPAVADELRRRQIGLVVNLHVQSNGNLLEPLGIEEVHLPVTDLTAPAQTQLDEGVRAHHAGPRGRPAGGRALRRRLKHNREIAGGLPRKTQAGVTQECETEGGIAADAVETLFCNIRYLSDAVGAQVRQFFGLHRAPDVLDRVEFVRVAR